MVGVSAVGKTRGKSKKKERARPKSPRKKRPEPRGVPVSRVQLCNAFTPGLVKTLGQYEEFPGIDDVLILLINRDLKGNGGSVVVSGGHWSEDQVFEVFRHRIADIEKWDQGPVLPYSDLVDGVVTGITREVQKALKTDSRIGDMITMAMHPEGAIVLAYRPIPGRDRDRIHRTVCEEIGASAS